MPRYRTRTGVVLTSICGEHLLVAAKGVRDQVPYITQISESAAFLWERLEHGADTDELLSAVLEEYEIEDPAQARAAIEGSIGQMRESGYLLPED
ncbi:MAG: PqqD family protein [Oscillospiraceae bacterium]|nr:PqqD family protein [Oscillospiraceae bacterium]